MRALYATLIGGIAGAAMLVPAVEAAPKVGERVTVTACVVAGVVPTAASVEPNPVAVFQASSGSAAVTVRHAFAEEAR